LKLSEHGWGIPTFSIFDENIGMQGDSSL